MFVIRTIQVLATVVSMASLNTVHGLVLLQNLTWMYCQTSCWLTVLS